MIHQDIPQQAGLFLSAAATGIGMLFVYDLFRIFRRVAKHGTVWIAVEDMFFWVGSALWLFRLMYRHNDGSIRGFVILGAAVGMLLYSVGCSRFVVRGGTAALRFAVNTVKRIVRILTAPFRVLGRPLAAGMKAAGRFSKKSGRALKKRLKKIGKAVRIGLCKL